MVENKDLKIPSDEVSDYYGRKGLREAHHEIYEIVSCRNAIVLDVGCGTGIGTKILSSKAKHIYAIDIDAEVLKIANTANAADNIIYSNESMAMINHFTFDVITCVRILEYTIGWEHILNKISNLTDTAYISIPINKNKDDVSSKYHWQNWDISEMREILLRLFQYVVAIPCGVNMVYICEQSKHKK